MEENPVKGSKSKLIIVSIIVIILVIASIGIYLIGGGASGITAMEGREIADDVANNWSENATVITAKKAGEMQADGRFLTWDYMYINTEIITESTECIGIRIYSNGTFTVRDNASFGPYKPIISWNIDSNRAYEIAQENSAINTFLGRGPSLEAFFLGSSTEKPIWILEWCDPGFMDDPKWAKIEIDANTGEVLYVEADN